MLSMTCVRYFEFMGNILHFDENMTIEECWFVAKNLDHGYNISDLVAYAKLWSSIKNNSCRYDPALEEVVAKLARNVKVF